MVMNKAIYCPAAFITAPRANRHTAPFGKGGKKHGPQHGKCFGAHGQGPIWAMPNAAPAHQHTGPHGKIRAPCLYIFTAFGASTRVYSISLVVCQPHAKKHRQQVGCVFPFFKGLQQFTKKSVGFARPFRCQAKGLQKFSAIYGNAKAAPVCSQPGRALQQHSFTQGKVLGTRALFHPEQHPVEQIQAPHKAPSAAAAPKGKGRIHPPGRGKKPNPKVGFSHFTYLQNNCLF